MDKDTQLLAEAYEQIIKEDVVTATASNGPVSQDTNLTRGPNTNIPTHPPKFKIKPHQKSRLQSIKRKDTRKRVDDVLTRLQAYNKWKADDEKRPRQQMQHPHPGMRNPVPAIER